MTRTDESSGDEVYATFAALMAALGCEVDESQDLAEVIEDYALDRLSYGVGLGLLVFLDREGERELLTLCVRVDLDAEVAVHMWSLETPVSVAAFYRFLEELDDRLETLRDVLELPAGREPDSDTEIVETLAVLFGASLGEALAEVGADWRPVGSDVVGEASQPVRYLLWDGRLVVGLDDEHVHVFEAKRVGDAVEVGDVLAWFELGSPGTRTITPLAAALRKAAGQK